MTTERIRVGVRFRPLSAREIASGSDDGWIYDEEERSVRENDVSSLRRAGANAHERHKIGARVARKYLFERVFAPLASNRDVYSKAAASCLGEKAAAAAWTRATASPCCAKHWKVG